MTYVDDARPSTMDIDALVRFRDHSLRRASRDARNEMLVSVRGRPSPTGSSPPRNSRRCHRRNAPR